jgi:hypothetical protein
VPASNVQQSLTEYRPSLVNIPSQQQSQSSHSRQPQSYETNLGNLFADQCQSPTSGRQQSQGQPMPVFLPEQPPGSFQHAPYMQSYDMPQQQQQYYYPNSPQSVSSDSGPLNYDASQNAEHHGLGTTDLGFLDFSSPVTGQNTISGPDGSHNHNPLTLSPLIQGLDQSTGVDLGFGMAFDFQHDWSEGGGYNLLDDFFFGGANVGN